MLALKRVTSALLPLLRRGAVERGVADIVNVTSIAGHIGLRGRRRVQRGEVRRARADRGAAARAERRADPRDRGRAGHGQDRRVRARALRRRSRQGRRRLRRRARAARAPRTSPPSSCDAVLKPRARRPRPHRREAGGAGGAVPPREGRPRGADGARAMMNLRGVPEGDPATHRRKRYVDATGRSLALLGVLFVFAYTVYVLWPDRPQWVTTAIDRHPRRHLGDLRDRRRHPHRPHAARSTLALRVASSRSRCSRPSCRCSARCASSASCRTSRSSSGTRRARCGPSSSRSPSPTRSRGSFFLALATLAGRARRAGREHHDVRRCDLVGARHDHDGRLRRPRTR